MADPKTPTEAKNEAHAYAGALETQGNEMDADTKLQYRMKQLAAETEHSHALKADKELRRRALQNLKAKDNSR